MASLATSLSVALDRIVDELVEVIAKEGLVALKRVLDEAGFGDSPHLKDYEVYAHTYGNTIEFEIVLAFEAVVPEDEATRQVLEAAEQAAAEQEEQSDATFGIGPSGPRRVVSSRNALRDARRPARNARRPARDARKGSRDRLIEKEIANITPRSARVTRDGRLSVALRRSARRVGDDLVMPEGEFQGLIGEFMKRLTAVIASAFAPRLEEIVAGYA